MPKWAYARINGLSEVRGGSSGVLVVGGGTAKRDQTQKKESLLCEACEQLFSAFEGTASRRLVQPDGSFPLLDELMHTYPDQRERLRLVPEEADWICRFSMSLFWRASVSREYFQTVSLGTDYDEAAREYLWGTSGFPPRCALRAQLIDDHSRTSGAALGIEEPRQESTPCGEFLQVGIFGLRASLLVGIASGGGMDDCLAKDQVVELLDGSKVRAEKFALFSASNPTKGFKKWLDLPRGERRR